MLRLAVTALVAFSTVCAGAADIPPAAPLTAGQIVEKNVAARGGLDAWRKIQTMAWAGHMESPDSPTQNMPFLLEQKRPDKTRFELMASNQKSLRVFDGAKGWKVRPARDGRPDAQPFTPQEVKFARDEPVIDGPLIDCEARGTTVSLAGLEEVEGRQAYRLNLRLASGERHDVWVDAQTFLEIKYDRTSYDARGLPRTVTVFYRNYREVQGLQIPTILEIGAGPARVPEKMVIEKVSLNPSLDDKDFSRQVGQRRRDLVSGEAMPDPAGRHLPLAPSADAPATLSGTEPGKK